MQDKMDFNNIKITVGGVEIPSENFNDTCVEIHPEYVPYILKFKADKKCNHEVETFSIRYDGTEIMNKNNLDVKDFTLEFKKCKQLNMFEYIVEFKAKYGSDTQKLCEKYSINLY